MAFSDWSTAQASNGTVLGVNIAENCAPGNVNDAIRIAMADLRTAIHPVLGTFLASSSLASARSNLGVTEGGASMTAFGALTNSANKLPYMTGGDAWALADFTSFGRTLAALGDVAALVALIGGLTVTASSLANPGYIHLSNGLKFQWGTGSLGANSSGSINYPLAFSSFAICIPNGGPNGTSSEGDVHVVAASGTTSQSIVNSGNATGFYNWIAVGV